MNEQDYIEKWLNGTLTEAEKVAFENTKAYQSIIKIDNALQSFKAPELNTQETFYHLQQKMRSTKSVRTVTMPWLQTLMKIAAVLVLMVGAYVFFISYPSTTVATAASEKVSIYLPDSSAVTLNALSEISYKPKRWALRRAVSLKGEAFFKVAKGSRFDVETSAGNVTVLGTQFTVKNRPEYFEVVCYEGLVRVTWGEKRVELPPFKIFRVIKGSISPIENISETTASWLSNESAFESVPFAEVLKEFERQYNITITTKNIDLKQSFTGRFVHSDLLLAIRSISIPLNLRYEIDSSQKNVELSGETQ